MLVLGMFKDEKIAVGPRVKKGDGADAAAERADVIVENWGVGRDGRATLAIRRRGESIARAERMGIDDVLDLGPGLGSVLLSRAGGGEESLNYVRLCFHCPRAVGIVRLNRAEREARKAVRA